jgi:hypothetical protein
MVERVLKRSVDTLRCVTRVSPAGLGLGATSWEADWTWPCPQVMSAFPSAGGQLFRLGGVYLSGRAAGVDWSFPVHLIRAGGGAAPCISGSLI